MIMLKEIIKICSPDWIVVCGKQIRTETDEVPEALLDFPVKEITGWDDGLTVELDAVIKPYPNKKEVRYE